MFYTHTPTVLRCSHLISIVVSSFTNGYNLYICHKNLSVTVDYIPDSIVLKGGRKIAGLFQTVRRTIFILHVLFPEIFSNNSSKNPQC